MWFMCMASIYTIGICPRHETWLLFKNGLPGPLPHYMYKFSMYLIVLNPHVQLTINNQLSLTLYVCML